MSDAPQPDNNRALKIGLAIAGGIMLLVILIFIVLTVISTYFGGKAADQFEQIGQSIGVVGVLPF